MNNSIVDPSTTKTVHIHTFSCLRREKHQYKQQAVGHIPIYTQTAPSYSLSVWLRHCLSRPVDEPEGDFGGGKPRSLDLDIKGLEGVLDGLIGECVLWKLAEGVFVVEAGAGVLVVYELGGEEAGCEGAVPRVNNRATLATRRHPPGLASRS